MTNLRNGICDLFQITDLPKTQEFKKASQGAESNIQGSLCEEMIEQSFLRRGVHVVRHSTFRKVSSDLFEERVLIKNVPFKNLYGDISRTEFVYKHPGGIEVRIECKTQESKGSVDEKFPYMLLNAQSFMPEKAIWFVIDGAGARPKAIQYLVNGASEYKRKIIRVYNLAEA